MSFIRNFSYTVTSNLLSIFISTIVILIVPKLIGIKEYGYWQLYLFYISYVGFLHFGWNDGVYLRFGGKEYSKLDKNLFFSQFWMLVFFQLFLAFIIYEVSIFCISNEDRLFIVKMTIVSMVIVNSRYLLVYLLQATNRMKENAQIIILEKVIYCCLIILLLSIGIKEYKLLIIADIIGKILALGYSTYCCKDIVFRRLTDFCINFKETLDNINVGIKLMFANIASILIIGIVRFGIERNWNVTTFGKVSLVISIANLIMIFVNAIGIIMFPLLRRTKVENLSKIYSTLRTLLMVPLLGLIIVYYPLKLIIALWLPQYADSLAFLVMIFPMCIFEGKMALLINTYLKTLRKERLMLLINLITVFLSIILTTFFTVVYESLLLIVFSIIILLAFRAILAESVLSKLLNINVFKDIILECTLSFTFIFLGWFTSVYGIIIYIVIYILYLVIKRKDIITTVSDLKSMIKK